MICWVIDWESKSSGWFKVKTFIACVIQSGSVQEVRYYTYTVLYCIFFESEKCNEWKLDLLTAPSDRLISQHICCVPSLWCEDVHFVGWIHFACTISRLKKELKHTGTNYIYTHNCFRASRMKSVRWWWQQSTRTLETTWMEDTGLQLASARGTGVFGKHLSVWNPLFRVARNCCLLQGQLASDARTPDRGQLERSTKNHRCAQSDLFIHLP